MLDGLDNIDWSQVKDWWGHSSEIPDLLRILAFGDEDASREADSRLYNTISHQQQLSDAALYTIPFLIEIVENENTKRKGYLLYMLGNLATAAYPGDGQGYCDKSLITECREAVHVGFDTYLNLLDHADKHVRQAAVDLSCIFTEERDRIIPSFFSRLQIEDEPRVNFHIVWYLRDLITRDTVLLENDMALLISLLDIQATEGEEFLLKIAAALAVNKISDSAPKTWEIFINFVSNPQLYFENIWWKAAFSQVFMALWDLEEQSILTTIRKILQRTDGEQAQTVAKLLLNQTLKRRNSPLVRGREDKESGKIIYPLDPNPRAKKYDAKELSNMQRLIISEILECDKVWEVESNLLASCDLPYTRETLRKALLG